MQTAVELLRTLVGFQTVSRRSNLELIDFVEGYLAGFGIGARRVYSSDGERANLYATIGPTQRGGICLSGHSDVVPTDGQPWSTDPFVLTERAGRLFGRGTSDMKGFIACVLAAVPHFVEHVGETPIHIAISYDEEIGCVGVRGLLEELAGDAAKPTGCIIGEPTEMRVASAHKGKSAYRCCVRGLAGHSAQPQLGVNAIEYAAELVAFLRRGGRALQSTGASHARYDPPFSTVQTGKIRGGVAINVVPDHCEFDFEIRQVPGDDAAQLVGDLTTYAKQTLLPEMSTVFSDAAIDLEQLNAYPGLKDDASSEALKALCGGLLGVHDFATLSFGTEGGLFQAIGIPTVVCGPGSINRAHKADEYVEIDELQQCYDFLTRLVTPS